MSSRGLPQTWVHIYVNIALLLTYRTQWLTVITIQTSMLVEGVMEMVKDAVLDPEILNHLKSRSVWKAASEYVSSPTYLTSFEPDVF